jgi:hypothetical protein
MAPVNTSAVKYRGVGEAERLGFSAGIVNQYDLDGLSAERRIQVRDSNHFEPSHQVRWMVQQMSHTPLPPPVVTRDAWVVDGNTRIRARKERKERFSPVIVVDVAYEAADQETRLKLEILGATLNADNGTPLTAQERQRVALRAFASLDLLPEHYERALGLSARDVVSIKQERAARDRIQKIGLDVNGHIRPPVLRALGRQAILNLNDEPYKQLVNLTMEAGLTAGEATDLAKLAKETGSDVAAVDALSNHRADLADRIVQQRLTGHPHPSATGQLRRNLGYLRQFAGSASALVEHNPAAIATHVELVTEARDVLNAVLELQQMYQVLPNMETTAPAADD